MGEGYGPLEIIVLNALRSKENWQAWHSLISETTFIDPAQRKVNEVIDGYFSQDGSGPVLSHDDLSLIVPNDPGVRSVVSNMVGTDQIKDTSVTNQAIRQFLREAAGKELGAKALEWAHTKPEKRDKYYEKILASARSLVDLEDNLGNRETIVEPVDIGSIDTLEWADVPSIPITFSPSMSKALGGGLPIGKWGGVMAPTGVGKTLTMCNMGASAIKGGHNVLHVSLEMDAQTLTQWYYCIMLGIPFDELIPKEEEAISEYRERQEKENWGRIFLYDYSGAYCSVGTVERLVKSSRNILGQLGAERHGREISECGRLEFDLLLLDYLELCDRKTDDLAGSLGSETRRLRRLAVKYSFAGVNGTQATRKAHERGVTELFDIGQSYAMAQAMDWLITLSQRPEEKLARFMWTDLKKGRFGSTNPRVQWVCNYPCLQLYERGTSPWQT